MESQVSPALMVAVLVHPSTAAQAAVYAKCSAGGEMRYEVKWDFGKVEQKEDSDQLCMHA